MKRSYSLLIIALWATLASAQNTLISDDTTGNIKNSLSTLQQTWKCEGCDLSKVDLSNFSSLHPFNQANLAMDCSHQFSLSKANLSYANLNKANFTACIRGMNTPFSQIDFNYANLAHAQLTGSIFYGVSFIYSNLPETQLTHAQLDLSNFMQANFSHAYLVQAQSKRDAMHGWGSNFYLANFCSANLTQANLYGYFQGANFSLAKLNNATLITSNDTIPPNIPYLQKLTGPALWTGTNFKDADLTGAHFYDADHLQGDKYMPADLSRAIFCHTIMPNGTVNNRDCRK